MICSGHKLHRRRATVLEALEHRRVMAFDIESYVDPNATGAAEVGSFRVAAASSDHGEGEDPIKATPLVQLEINFETEEGQIVSSLEKGREYWLRLTAKDQRAEPLGMYGAWVDLTFAEGALSVVGQPQGMGVFTGLVRGQQTSPGQIASLGAFSSSLIFTRVATSDIAKVKVRAEALGDIGLDVNTSPNRLYEVLVFGLNNAIEHNQIMFVFPQIKVVDNHDANADGKVSPLDALIVIDHLNRQRDSGEGEPPQVTQRPVQPTTVSRMAQMDSSGDGNISPLDVLLIIDFLQQQRRRSGTAGSGEFSGDGLDSGTRNDNSAVPMEPSAVVETAVSDSLIASLACNYLEHEALLKKSKR